MHGVNRDGDVTNCTKLWPVPRLNSCANRGVWSAGSGRVGVPPSSHTHTHTSLSLLRCLCCSQTHTQEPRAATLLGFLSNKSEQRCLVSTLGCDVTQISRWGSIPRRRCAPRAAWDPPTRCWGCFQQAQSPCWAQTALSHTGKGQAARALGTQQWPCLSPRARAGKAFTHTAPKTPHTPQGNTLC